eukprot:10951239-Alexandrium_andersonii.AAC.1
MSASLVGSEMCIRDRPTRKAIASDPLAGNRSDQRGAKAQSDHKSSWRSESRSDRKARRIKD